MNNFAYHGRAPFYAVSSFSNGNEPLAPPSDHWSSAGPSDLSVLVRGFVPLVSVHDLLLIECCYLFTGDAEDLMAFLDGHGCIYGTDNQKQLRYLSVQHLLRRECFKMNMNQGITMDVKRWLAAPRHGLNL